MAGTALHTQPIPLWNYILEMPPMQWGTSGSQCRGHPLLPGKLLMELLLVICAYSKCLTSVFPMLPAGTGIVFHT